MFLSVNYHTGSMSLSDYNNSNLMNNTIYSPLSLTGDAVIGICLTIIIILTICGNILVIAAVATYHRLRTVTNHFVVSLAVADMTVAILVMPFSLIYQIIGQWTFGWIFCYFWISCDVTCCTASILHLCLISLDRYLAITRPLTYHSRMSQKRALLMIAGVWVCSIGLSFVPIFMGWFAKGDDVTLYVDSPSCGLFVNRTYAVISSFMSFYIPLVVMIFAYVKIFRIARHQAKEIQKLENTISGIQDNTDTDILNPDKVRKRSKKLKRDTKAIKTLGTLMGLFCVCWLPFFLMYLILPFCEVCFLPQQAESFITWLGYANSGINPCVYAFLNRDFRMGFKRILSRCFTTKCSECLKHNSQSPENSGDQESNNGRTYQITHSSKLVAR